MDIKLTRLDKQRAFRFLGYGKDVPDEATKHLMNVCEQELLTDCVPKYIYRVFDMEEVDGGIKLTGTNMLLTGTSISKHLSGCRKAVCLCATMSTEADKLIRRAQAENMAKAVVMDALASVSVEQICDMAEKEIKIHFHTYHQTWRFGIGYGDLPLHLQPMFLDILEASKRIGVYANSDYILVPGKSVTCIIGISDTELSREKVGCSDCHMKGRCSAANCAQFAEN